MLVWVEFHLTSGRIPELIACMYGHAHLVPFGVPQGSILFHIFNYLIFLSLFTRNYYPVILDF